MSESAKKRWMRVAEVALAVLIIALLVATWLPALISRGNPVATGH
jgi:hypothetical protein